VTAGVLRVFVACGLLAGLAEAQVAGPRINYVSNSPNEMQVVLVAHEDDWQLFMGDKLVARLDPGNRVVFVYLTAGDNGRDSLYWHTRERAALKSTRVAVGSNAPDDATNCRVVYALRHPIMRCDVGQTRSYFLRLPDGKRDGRGFPRNHYQSLRKLRAGRIMTLDALDGSTSYLGWSDLRKTVTALASEDSMSVVLHALDPSVARNPHDHFDHRMAGILADEVRRGRKWPTTYYVGYALATRAANRSADQTRVKTELFLAYDREMAAGNPAWSAYREHPRFYAQCMQRTYSKTYSPIALTAK
jgi:hypothetical protein